jgi:hypothetical protein
MMTCQSSNFTAPVAAKERGAAPSCALIEDYQSKRYTKLHRRPGEKDTRFS